MSNSAGNAFQQLLGKLAAGVQRGEVAALNQILDLLGKQPREPNLLHLAGLYHLNTQNYNEALDYFQRSLKQVPRQPELHNNMGNAYRAMGDSALAEHHYLQALGLQPRFQNAAKNLGLLFLKLERFEEAEKTLQQALTLSPQDHSILSSLGDVYRTQHDYEEAIRYYQQALSIKPTYANALHNLGSCEKALERPQQALDLYTRAQQSAPSRSEIDLSIGNLLFDLGEYDGAERHFISAVQKSPQMVEAHATLSELYWQTGRHDEIENSYRIALRDAPNNMPMRLSLLELLLASGRFESAQQLVRESLDIEQLPKLLHSQGKLFANELNYSLAKESLEAALQQEFNLDCAQDLIKLNILQGDYETAIQLIENAQLNQPHDQLSWALKSLCWRLLDDERYEWLNDYQRFVKSYTLPTPDGYATLAEFLSELENTLLAMHSTQFAPSRQTLKGGTQTPGRLLHKTQKAVQMYRSLLVDVVDQYVTELPNDPTHPLLGRKSTGFEFSGSWSVKLGPGGYHVNHVHPQGWVSSACYVSLPERIRGASHNQGAIKFGESGLGLGDREIVERVVRPEAGMLVLFPSYTWHGTYDFEGGEEAFRLTAPFDVVPTNL